jgi:hypothetical protein
VITSKQILNIIETYLTTKNISSNDVVFYVNPSSSDYAELYKTGPYIRFLVDSRPPQKVYVWNGYITSHSQVSVSGALPVNLSCVAGQAKMLSKNSLPVLTEFRPKRDDTKDYSWISKYVKLPSQSLNNYYLHEL